jgi:hypothetical protein
MLSVSIFSYKKSYDMCHNFQATQPLWGIRDTSQFLFPRSALLLFPGYWSYMCLSLIITGGSIFANKPMLFLLKALPPNASASQTTVMIGHLNLQSNMKLVYLF